MGQARDNLDRAVSDGRTDLVFAAARAMSGNSSRQCCSHSTVQLQWHSTVRSNIDPACHARCSKCALSDLSRPNNLLSYEQAGFRKREECVGQVVSLVDIIQRRQNAGLNTHVLFIDIRKAFDTVPVGALLWKLQNMGFPRRTLAFLKALYTSSSARARAGSLLSDPFPSLDYRETPNPIRGLMYADDVAVFADSEQSLLAASTAIEQWANQWEMQFGVAKCGIISFTGHLAPRLDNPLDIRLHGQLVSRVESYKYLGVLIDSKLDHSAWLKQKRSALEHTISAFTQCLANHQLTVNLPISHILCCGHGQSLLWA
ncbi:hypothetical protein BASA81_018123 [Batrachochytrium salamandrivorans]|nr:hypothetical protein BASA81_018123 [Batrachochytrium salamandrivorans]